MSDSLLFARCAYDRLAPDILMFRTIALLIAVSVPNAAGQCSAKDAKEIDKTRNTKGFGSVTGCTLMAAAQAAMLGDESLSDSCSAIAPKFEAAKDCPSLADAMQAACDDAKCTKAVEAMEAAAKAAMSKSSIVRERASASVKAEVAPLVTLVAIGALAIGSVTTFKIMRAHSDAASHPIL